MGGIKTTIIRSFAILSVIKLGISALHVKYPEKFALRKQNLIETEAKIMKNQFIIASVEHTDEKNLGGAYKIFQKICITKKKISSKLRPKIMKNHFFANFS